MSNPLLDQETAIGEGVKMWLKANQHPHNAPQQKKCYYVFEDAEIYALYLCIIQISKPAMKIVYFGVNLQCKKTKVLNNK